MLLKLVGEFEDRGLLSQTVIISGHLSFVMEFGNKDVKRMLRLLLQLIVINLLRRIVVRPRMTVRP